MIKNVMLTISYDGKNFNGWQRQPGKRTVQGTLEEVLTKYIGKEVKIDGCSRTDSGVHAIMQTATFSSDFNIPLKNLVYSVNNYLCGGKNSMYCTSDLRIVKAKIVPKGFHARHDAKGKTYRYVINNAKKIDIFRKDYSYQITTPLDIDKMIEGSKYIIGTHDFKSFESSGSNERETTIRTVSDITIKRGSGSDIIVEITGDGFLYNMVRIIVGTLIEMGLSKRDPKSMKDIIDGKNRALSGFTAPASGLYLKKIYY